MMDPFYIHSVNGAYISICHTGFSLKRGIRTSDKATVACAVLNCHQNNTQRDMKLVNENLWPILCKKSD